MKTYYFFLLSEEENILFEFGGVRGCNTVASWQPTPKFLLHSTHLFHSLLLSPLHTSISLFMHPARTEPLTNTLSFRLEFARRISLSSCVCAWAICVKCEFSSSVIWYVKRDSRGTFLCLSVHLYNKHFPSVSQKPVPWHGARKRTSEKLLKYRRCHPNSWRACRGKYSQRK